MHDVCRFILCKNNIKPNKNVKLVFTADEEATGKGILSILNKNILKDVDFIIVPENTDEYVVIKEKRSIMVRIRIIWEISSWCKARFRN